MANAYNNLYGTAITAMPATDRYIMFTPTSNEEAKLILSSDIILYDYDLLYEVVEMGDYFQKPIENGFPTFYAVVPVEDEIPNVKHEVIDELYLDKSNPLLIAEAYLLTNNIKDIQTLTGYSLDEIGANNIEYIVGNTDELDCSSPCVIKYRMKTITEGGRTRVVIEAYCDCEVPSYVGCSPTGDVRKPYGQIRVFDTQLSDANNTNTYMGVGKTKIVIKDNWFDSYSTQTDLYGCYKFNRKFWGRIWVYVEYKGTRCEIRGKKNGWHNFFTYFYPVREYLGFARHHRYSNIITNIHMWSTIGSKTHVLWGGATIINALNEYYNYAAQEEINPPPSNLDIYEWAEGDKSGFATMASRLGDVNTATAITLGSATSSTFLYLPFIYAGLASLHSVIPDVMISIDFNNSDALKHLANHELTHASHYTVVDNDFWMTVIEAEIQAFNVSGDPHGNPSSWEAGRIALCESWAEHIGMSFTHKTYPLKSNTSIGNYTYLEKLEKTWNETSNHIPIGLYHDLIDSGVEPQSANEYSSGTTTVIDNVSGFSNQQMFNCLNVNTTNVNIFKQVLINNYLNSTSNTNSEVNDLFNSY